MTFTAVDQLKRRFPDKDIYLFSASGDYHRDKKEKEIYDFGIIPWKAGTQINLLKSERVIRAKSNRITCSEREFKQIKQIIDDTEFFVDINGYCLTSQFSTSRFKPTTSTYRYLLNIIIAKKFSKPIYILPQSIGPFNYPYPERILLHILLKKYLKYPDKIMPREEDGVKRVKRFTKGNVERCRDIALLNDGYNLDNIFTGDFQPKEIDVPEESVGIIPNSKVMKRENPRKVYSVYKSIIEKLLQAGKRVYLLRHSHEDFSICRKINRMFEDNENVVLVKEELNAIELEKTISKFDFIVGSRYHSVIHAYKNGVPALVIGWAVKYLELLEDFNQVDYIFDSRCGLNEGEVLSALDKMIMNFEDESETIANLQNLKEGGSVFSKIQANL